MAYSIAAIRSTIPNDPADNKVVVGSRTPKLLSLPDELLLRIAWSLSGPFRIATLRNLSLACRKLRPVGKEALLRTCVLRSDYIPEFFKTITDHPGFAAKVLHIELTAFEAGITMLVQSIRKLEKKIDTDEWKDRIDSAWRELTDDTSASFYNSHNPKAPLDRIDCAFSTLLTVVLAGATNVKSLSLSQQGLFRLRTMLPLFKQSTPHCAWSIPSVSNHLCQNLLGQLTSIEITVGPHADLSWERGLSLHRFKRLKRACVPIGRILWECPAFLMMKNPNKLTKPRDVLPQSLTYLKLDCRKQSPGTIPVHWIRDLLLDSGDTFESLVMLQLRFFGAFRGFRGLFLADDSTRGTRKMEMREFLQDAANASAELEAVFGNIDSEEVTEVYDREAMLAAL